MGVWIPTKDGLRCTRHDESFAKGAVCSRCSVDPPPDKDMAASKRPARARRRGKVPSPIDHEREFNAIADLALTWAKEEDEDARNWEPPPGDVKVVGGPSRSTAAKLLDCSIKARRAACALAQWREDWENTERLEKSARALAERRENRSPSAAEVRH